MHYTIAVKTECFMANRNVQRIAKVMGNRPANNNDILLVKLYMVLHPTPLFTR